MLCIPRFISEKVLRPLDKLGRLHYYFGEATHWATRPKAPPGRSRLAGDRSMLPYEADTRNGSFLSTRTFVMFGGKSLLIIKPEGSETPWWTSPGSTPDTTISPWARDEEPEEDDDEDDEDDEDEDDEDDLDEDDEDLDDDVEDDFEDDDLDDDDDDFDDLEDEDDEDFDEDLDDDEDDDDEDEDDEEEDAEPDKE
jgi:hypothetical protein